MIARRIGRFGGGVALLASGTYFFVYLWRWEWNRAVVAGIVFLAAEIGLAAAAILERVSASSSSSSLSSSPPSPRRPAGARSDRDPEPDPDQLARLRETAPPPRDHFAWLSPRQDRFGVFVPVLMGMGVVVSALAWLVERLARATAKPVLEHKLAGRLAAVAWPRDGLVPLTEEPLALLSRPIRR